MAELKKMSSMKDRPLYIFLAEPGVGKTTLGASASKFYDPTYQKSVSLDDQIWISMERDGFRPFVGKKIEIPYIFDLTECSGKVFETELKDAIKKTRELASKGGVTQLVIDTHSSIDKTWAAYKVNEYPGLALYPALFLMHRQLLFEQLFSLPLQIIMLMHVKGSKLLEADLRKAQGLDSSDRLVMDLGGNQSSALYRAQATLITPLERSKVGTGAAARTEWVLHLRDHPTIESKCGYSFLADKEPANLCMLLDKIASNRAS
jgi:hypothetical protein